MSTRQALVQRASDGDDDLPTAKFATLPEHGDSDVIDLTKGDADELPSFEVSIDLQSESNFYVGFAEDLSDGGIFVATHLPRRIGTRVEVSISLPEGAPLCAQGTVRWVREYSEATEGAPGMGVQLDGVSREDIDRILTFARERPPMFFDGEILVAERVASH
jgi:uncharacterized protein (TIGR02266 family)